MTNYYTPTVVEPLIPASDVTPLERLLLEEIFEVSEDHGRLYLSHETGPNDYPEIARDALERALAESSAFESRMNAHAAAALAAAPAEDGHVFLELDRIGASPDAILQDIVRRSTTLKYLIVLCAFTCAKMRPDGFGGAVTLITADAILAKSTHDALAELMAEAGIAND